MNSLFFCVVVSADETYSPEPIKGEDQEAEDESGSFSPILLHGDENEEVVDPEEDRAILVTFEKYFVFMNQVYMEDNLTVWSMHRSVNERLY